MHGDPPAQRILVVDDSPSSISTLIQFLRESYTMFVASSGLAALKVAAEQLPDLILLDVVMPHMDGHEVCRRLKADPRTEAIPVIFLTAQRDIGDELTGFELGAVDFIAKPFSYLVVERRVRTHMELKRVRDLLERQSLVDELTGIANRRRFNEFAALMWALSLRRSSSYSLVLSDIDHFKAYNDNYGHPAGDSCLKQVAKAQEGALQRQSDLVARYGGEEFVCVLPDTDIDGALQVAERMRCSVEALRIPHAHSPIGECVTMSVGVSTTNPTADGSFEKLLESADAALYRAKQSGRNRVST